MTTAQELHQETPRWATELTGRLTGDLVTPDDAGYDRARAAWNLEAQQRPAGVVLAENAADVQETVRAARALGLGVAVQATGHGVSRPCDGGLLVNTARMTDVVVDPVARLARVGAGAVWRDVVSAAAVHGLAGLPGSSTGVGVVGYTLGGGFGWLGRRYGLAAHSVTGADVVTATGELVRASAQEHPGLFWGLLGGTGNLGIVTSLEFRLHPLTQVYAGNLYYPLERAGDVLDAFAGWIRDAPDDLTAAATFRRFPGLPAVPSALRGRSAVALRGCWSGDVATGAVLVDRARSLLGPALVDTFAPMPVSQLASVSSDPVDPLGAVQHSETLAELTPDVIDLLTDLVGPGASSPLVMLELRTLGGALAGPPAALNPMARTHGVASLNAVGATTVPGADPGRIRSFLRELEDRLRPHVTGDTYVNFLDLASATPDRVRAAYTTVDLDRLTRLKDEHDPHDLFRFNRPLT